MVSTKRLPESAVNEALEKLSSSVNETEEGFRVEFTTEWCGS